MLTESNNSTEESSLAEIVIPQTLRFWLILPFYIPSLLCSLFVLYHFLFNRTLRRALHNHVIILLLLINLVVQLTSIPWILNYYRLGYVSLPMPSFCLTWLFMDEALYIATTILFSWATIERHILIFHSQLVSTRRNFILFHWLPIVIIVIYSIAYNTIVLLFPPCENVFDYSGIVCGYPLCFYEKYLVGIWDVIVHDFIPTIIIIVSSLGLLVRTIRQKHRVRRPIRWRNHRKMTIQILSISALYLVIYIPEMLMEFIYLCGVSEEVGADFMMYAEFLTYFGNLILPFICAGSMRELKKKVKTMFRYGERQINPTQQHTVTISHRIGRQPVRGYAFAE